MISVKVYKKHISMENLNEQLKRIKLLSLYNSELTLNENESLINEDNDISFELEEQPRELFRTLLGDVKGISSQVKDFSLFRGDARAAEKFLKDAAAGRAAAKDLGTFSKDVLKNGSKLKDSKPGLFQGASESYAKNLFNNSKDKLAIQFKNANTADRKMLLKNAGYPEASINSIMKEYGNLEKVGKTGSGTKAVAGDTKAATGDLKATEQQIKNNIQNVRDVNSASQNLVKVEQDLVKAGVKNKGWLQKMKSWRESLKKIKPNGWIKLQKIKSRLRSYWLLKLGLIGGGAYLIYKAFMDGTTLPPEDPKNEFFDTCITDLLEKDGVTMSEFNGDPIVVVTKTGVKEYDDLGGLTFYTNKRVFSNDGKGVKKGTWSCGGSSGEKLQTIDTGSSQITEAIPKGNNTNLYSDIETMIDLLDFPVSKQNMRDANAMLDKYIANGQGKQFLDLYQKSGYGGGSLSKSLKYVATSQAETTALKSEMLSKVEKMKNSQGSDNTDTTTGGGTGTLGNISIVWDGQDSGGEGDNSGGNKVKKSIYHDCSKKQLPHEFGCKSSIVKEIQSCIGMESKYHTGNFGPLTKKKLTEMGYDVTNGITQEMYDKIKQNCGSTPEKTLTKPKEKFEPISKQDKPELPTDLKPIERPDTMNSGGNPESDQKYLEQIMGITDENGNPILFKDGKRYKYKGPDLMTDQLQTLDRALGSKGYKRIKQKDKKYGEKYVWLRK